jgi:signal transduction histidine kinase
MSHYSSELSKTQRSNTAEFATRWAGDAAIAATVGAAFYLVAKITSWGIAFQPDKVSLFWPPTGISCGLLIVLGPRRRWPAIAGIVAASAVINHESWNNLWITPAVALCNAVEALTVAGLFTRYFGGADFPLDRARNIFGLLGAAAVGAFASSLIATAVLRLSLGPSIVIVFTLQHWFASVFVGIVTVTPLVIGLADAVRHPPSRREYVEGTFALLSLAVLTSIIVALPREAWEVLLPVAWPFPILLWLAARSRPVFAAAGAFLVSNIIVWTTTFAGGHFGDANSSLGNRVLEAQADILFLAVSAYLLAALFAERRKSEALLTRSNSMLERERNNKLMNAEATSAAIAHELKQPLAAMVANADASLEFLEHTPPNVARAKEALSDIVADGHHASDALNGVRTLFRSINQAREPIDVNELAGEVLHSMRSELNEHGVMVQSELAPDVLPIQGNRGQLQQVIFNLAHNAVEAMVDTSDRSRVLRLITQREDRDRIVIAVQDTGPGIDPGRLDEIFDAFMTTKPQGTGLGLAICRVIVERHGGELNAYSDGKNGALFQLSLPVEPADDRDKSLALS